MLGLVVIYFELVEYKFKYDKARCKIEIENLIIWKYQGIYTFVHGI